MALTAAPVVFAVFLMALYAHARTVSRTSELRSENQSLSERLLDGERRLQQERRARHEIQDRLKRERELFVDGPIVLFRCAATDGWPIEYISPNAIQFGFDFHTLMEERTPLQAIIHPDDLPRVQSARMNEQGMYGMPYLEIDYRIVLPDQRTRRVYAYILAVSNGDGEVAHYDGYLLDITNLELTERATAGERAQAVLNSIGDAVITTDTKGRVASMNPAGEQLTGLTVAESTGMPLAQAFQVRDETTDEPLEDPVDACLQADATEAQTRYAILQRRDGWTFPVRQSVAAIRDRGGEAIGAAVVLHGMSESRSLAREIEYHAIYDSLTDLINRREFQNLLIQALRVAVDDNQTHVCLYMDLDQFRLINDTCGHAAGDQLLRQLAGILKHELRQSDSVARLGGDEFGVLLLCCSIQRGVEIAEALRAAVRAFHFTREDKNFEVGVSIGIVPITRESSDAASILSDADVACYVAKDLGRNRIHVYAKGDEESSRRQGEMQWVSQITRALEDNRLVLYYQDIVPLEPRNGQNTHIEILVRMLDENGDLIMPDEFLPAAERYNLMPTLDRWVVRNTFAWYTEHAAGKRLQAVINLSGTTLSDPGFLGFIHSEFKSSKIPPSMVCFELTETAAVSNLATASHFIGELKSMGCQFSLDDFGSGLSSFAYLKSLPVDYLKIDGRFVRNMVEDPVDCTMVSAINEVGQAMGIETIAEYAESNAILRELKRLAVDFAQGYAISRPQPLGIWRERLVQGA